MLELEGTKGEVISVPSVHLVWITPDAEYRIARMARVSNPKILRGEDAAPYESPSLCAVR